MDESTLYGFVLTFIMGIHGNTFLLVVIWGGLTLLSWIWSGLERAIRLFLFPGYIFYFLVKYLLLKKLGYEIKIYHMFTPHSSSVKTMVRLENLRHSTFLILSLSFSTIVFYSILNFLVELTTNNVSKFFIAWLSVSIFVNGLPRKQDFLNVFLSSLKIDVGITLIYLNAFAVLAVGSLIFDLALNVGLFFIYFLSVGLISLTYPSKQGNSHIITSDDLILLEED